jgi:DNA-binding LacI/PurR family transcriptional regulator
MQGSVPPSRRRPQPKPAADRVPHAQIVARLRSDIVQGLFAPGSRLPTRMEMRSRFDASSTTVQRALDHLVEDGFAVVNSRQGTFVADRPPHLTRYALVFPRVMRHSRFWLTLRSAAEHLALHQGRRIPVYLLRNRSTPGGTFARLEDDVVAHRLAGLMLTWVDVNGHIPAKSPVARQADMPRVQYSASTAVATWPTVGFDIHGFYTTAVDRLLREGRRRLAHVGIKTQGRSVRTFREVCLARGLEAPSYLDHQIGLSAPDHARSLVQLLMRLPADQRPDGLVVSDDNLLEHVQAGLIDAGVRLPEDLAVVAHVNFPASVHIVLPITPLGFDCAELIHAMAHSIDQQRAGRAVPPQVLLPARWSPYVPETAPSVPDLLPVHPLSSAGVTSCR